MPRNQKSKNAVNKQPVEQIHRSETAEKANQFHANHALPRGNNTTSKNKIFYCTLFLGLVAGISIAFLYQLHLQHEERSQSTEPCSSFTHEIVGNASRPVRTHLFREIHGENEKLIADCIDSLGKLGDYLLLETENTGKPVPCDTLLHQPSFKRFNKKLICKGADIPMDETRRLAGVLSYHVNFLAKYSEEFFVDASTSQHVSKNIKRFSDFFADHNNFPPLPSQNPQELKGLLNSHAKYLRKLAQRIRGLSIREIRDFLIKENNELAYKAEGYLKKSREDGTNPAINQEIKSHLEETKGSSVNVFGVFGDNHLSSEKNKELEKMLVETGEPAKVYKPRNT